jgi:hypothetical protein
MRRDNRQKIVNLALQGGGSHGAFTWGVLDRLLEEERLSIEGIYRDQRRCNQCGRYGLWSVNGRTRRGKEGFGAPLEKAVERCGL